MFYLYFQATVPLKSVFFWLDAPCKQQVWTVGGWGQSGVPGKSASWADLQLHLTHNLKFYLVTMVTLHDQNKQKERKKY